MKMVKQTSIFYVKLVHSIIWLVMALAVFHILFSGITGIINITTFVCIGLIIVEILVLLINNWSCPLTNVARKVKPDWQDGDDIFLPRWVAIHNKQIFGTVFIVGLGLVIIRLVLL